jgi:hypothetical protein
VLQEISEMQAEFASFAAANALLPDGERLTSSEMLVDPEYAAILEDKGQELIDEVDFWVAWAERGFWLQGQLGQRGGRGKKCARF